MILLSAIESGTPQAQKLINDWANEADRGYAARRRKPGAAHNSLLARAVLRKLLKDRNVEILAEENGKPYLKNGPHISLSHSNKMVAAAVCGEAALGIDIEFHKLRDFDRLAGYAFGPKEIEAVKKMGTEEFYRLWVLREAIAKIGGESIFYQMNGSDIDQEKYQLIANQPRPGYSLGVAVVSSGKALECMMDSAGL